jgi:hypothetical protein
MPPTASPLEHCRVTGMLCPALGFLLTIVVWGVTSGETYGLISSVHSMLTASVLRSGLVGLGVSTHGCLV